MLTPIIFFYNLCVAVYSTAAVAAAALPLLSVEMQKGAFFFCICVIIIKRYILNWFIFTIKSTYSLFLTRICDCIWVYLSCICVYALYAYDSGNIRLIVYLFYFIGIIICFCFVLCCWCGCCHSPPLLLNLVNRFICAFIDWGSRQPIISIHRWWCRCEWMSQWTNKRTDSVFSEFVNHSFIYFSFFFR